VKHRATAVAALLVCASLASLWTTRALAADGDAPGAGPPEPEAPLGEIDAHPVSPALASPERLTPPEQEGPPTLPLVPFVYADVTAAFARAPTTLLGGRLGAGIRRGWFSIAAEGHAETSPSSTRISPVDRVEAYAFSGALVPCGYFSRFQLCGVTTVGSLAVKALDVLDPRAHGALFVVVGARMGVEIAVSDAIVIRLHGEVGIPLVRTTYATDGIQRATTGVAEESISAGILGRFR
jgi:hypothetical protein